MPIRDVYCYYWSTGKGPAGSTRSDQRQPGSNVTRIAMASPTLTISALPLFMGRVSAGPLNLFFTIFGTPHVIDNFRVTLSRHF
jgi:hypothetical protein